MRVKYILAYKILREIAHIIISMFMNIYRSLSFVPQRIRSIVREHRYENRFGISTCATAFRTDNMSLYKDNRPYAPTPYPILKKIADYLKLNDDDIFIDLGCGKGRTLFFMAAQGARKVIGIEADKGLADIARENLASFKFPKEAIELVNADAASFKFTNETVFFMFNPFGAETIMKVLDNIRASLVSYPRNIRIAYYSHAHRRLLDKQGWLVADGLRDDKNILVWRSK